MHDDASWNRIVDAIDTSFGLTNHGRLTREVSDNHELTESVSFIEFNRGGESLRLERVSGPAIIDRRSVGARRAGASIHFENIYDPSEITHKTLLFRRVGEDWQQIELNDLGL